MSHDIAGPAPTEAPTPAQPSQGPAQPSAGNEFAVAPFHLSYDQDSHDPAGCGVKGCDRMSANDRKVHHVSFGFDRALSAFRADHIWARARHGEQPGQLEIEKDWTGEMYPAALLEVCARGWNAADLDWDGTRLRLRLSFEQVRTIDVTPLTRRQLRRQYRPIQGNPDTYSLYAAGHIVHENPARLAAALAVLTHLQTPPREPDFGPMDDALVYAAAEVKAAWPRTGPGPDPAILEQLAVGWKGTVAELIFAATQLTPAAH